MSRAGSWRLALLAAGACGVFGAGWLVGARGGHCAVTSTAFHEYGKIITSTMAGYEFQAYGRFSTQGLVVRVYAEGDADSAHCRTILVVSDPEGAAHQVGSYEVFHDRGVYLVSVRNRLVPFSILHVVNQERIAQVRVGDQIRVAGEYGEIEFHGGATCSLSNLGIFVCAIAEVEVTHAATPAVP